MSVKIRESVHVARFSYARRNTSNNRGKIDRHLITVALVCFTSDSVELVARGLRKPPRFRRGIHPSRSLSPLFAYH